MQPSGGDLRARRAGGNLHLDVTPSLLTSLVSVPLSLRSRKAMDARRGATLPWLGIAPVRMPRATKCKVSRSASPSYRAAIRSRPHLPGSTAKTPARSEKLPSPTGLDGWRRPYQGIAVFNAVSAAFATEVGAQRHEQADALEERRLQLIHQVTHRFDGFRETSLDAVQAHRPSPPPVGCRVNHATSIMAAVRLPPRSS